MRDKPRVHELAKEFGVESKIVLAKLKEMGELVKSASSTVEAPWERRLREEFGTPRATRPRPSQLRACDQVSAARAIEITAALSRAAAVEAEKVRAENARRRALAVRAQKAKLAVDDSPAERERLLGVGQISPTGARGARASARHIDTSTDISTTQVAEVLVLWDELCALAPTPDRCVGYLAQQGGLPRGDVQRLRTVRNRCAHPAEQGWPSSYEITMALSTARELRRRLSQAS